MNPPDAAAVDEFHARFRHLSEALRTEMTFAGEAATIRRVLDHGSPEERSVLLIVLGHAEHIMMKFGTPDAADPEAVRAADERARCFLRGLVGDDEPVGKETLRPALDALGERLLVLNTNDPDGELNPFTVETAKSYFS
jgi:hypothetical protein